jgi:hypothetical protein
MVLVSNFFLLVFGTCTNAILPKTLKRVIVEILHEYSYFGVMPSLVLVGLKLTVTQLHSSAEVS